MRLMTVVGARPNFIKVAPLILPFDAAGIEHLLVHTGQHYDASMSAVFFSDLEIPEPKWYLGVGSGTHAVQTAVAMMRLEELLVREQPDAVMVVGDVNSTLAGALAAAKVNMPVIHLEAGLRSGDMSMPEEVNRLVTDQLSALLLAPTHDAIAHLAAEGIEAERVRLVGNIMAESVLAHRETARERDVPSSLGLSVGEYVVATLHRPENTEHPDRLSAVMDGLAECGRPVVMPLHPRTAERLRTQRAHAGGQVRLLEPLGYLDMIGLLADAAAVVTDSGGVQEEACVLRTPCVTVRRNTERVVTLEHGANRIVDPTSAAVVGTALTEALAQPRAWPLPEMWDGFVSERVVDAILGGVDPLRGCG